MRVFAAVVILAGSALAQSSPIDPAAATCAKGEILLGWGGG